ncbi:MULTISPECIES: diaminopimelate epimerase [Acetobacter]|jgi:diaminopimelate epimerase|uniref:Diaminopimelate epimerase n=1 Tax=Acetobacter lovaniensis TaxID=104100 RepID=A0A841QGC4_9PROT|nr:diaminopimelate epimerase [Acetobacter lovaniensis]MBB6457102.1 diaminopimelate epimerase [Acetobacter lovaniensis]MCI1697685.1 diaminopimelate epimerase [Acetobacter lovaniensis]MCI1795787.1 diaminopimelate epimerase [Acetobacter lovaniensis]MCP1239554.1 diaminopimelate epimerase [Acetobacter lovaniensis]NHN81313.1 diaminopimelate epimerase [Acetobacter lovaniensis]
MLTSFYKMHGLGNDFVILDERTGDLPLTPGRIAALAHRRRGIGCDQLVTLRAPTADGADVLVRFFNPDGSEAGACGNASRCVADLVWRCSGNATPVLQTRAGVLPTSRTPDGLITVDMGAPRTHWQDVPLAMAVDTLHLPLPGDPAAASMGNPHATFFVSDFGMVAQGDALEHDPIFPERANIGFARMDGPHHMRLKVHERGAGVTEACGSGACAAVVNAVRRGLAARTCTVELDGGTLHIVWSEQTGHVLMTGSATTAFEGTVDLAAYPS